ncbi:serine/threonine-protein kinase 16 isoform X2 [Chrysoperla carnea]|uniref:serine/threonine-protein kinase 16 isoform X2 n=1 Tax=Chrysoperla carnea TaxID=189513 RepID=UPI001D098A08|nr:serine/threonine-protein kinase 16 isoform X2 [Chrysoperla carnea]
MMLHKFFVVARITLSGFSVVDLVENAHTKKKYALKKIICHAIEDQKNALREIEITNQLKHDNIIKIIDSTFKGSADIVINTISEIFIVLPYFPRGTLANYLEIRGTTNHHLSVNEICTTFSKICDAVRCMHEFKPEPIAHRDLKTANICLTDSLQPVIIDLGSATEARVKICGSQEAQQLQDLAAERCSMPYRAPELFNVESYCMIDERTDIWSLGCILYAMCYFKSPFDTVHERGDSVALAVLSGNIHFPEENAPYPEELHDLIKFILKVQPSERPFIYSVLSKTQELLSKVEMRV